MEVRGDITFKSDTGERKVAEPVPVRPNFDDIKPLPTGIDNVCIKVNGRDMQVPEGILLTYDYIVHTLCNQPPGAPLHTITAHFKHKQPSYSIRRPDPAHPQQPPDYVVAKAGLIINCVVTGAA